MSVPGGHGHEEQELAAVAGREFRVLRDELALQFAVAVLERQVLGPALLVAFPQALLHEGRQLDRLDRAEARPSGSIDGRRPELPLQAARSEAPLPDPGMRVHGVESAHRGSYVLVFRHSS
jgi:hypothetical protein